MEKSNRGRREEEPWNVGDVLFNKETGLYWLVTEHSCHCISQGHLLGALCRGMPDGSCYLCGIVRKFNKYKNPDKYLARVLAGKIVSVEPNERTAR